LKSSQQLILRHVSLTSASPCWCVPRHMLLFAVGRAGERVGMLIHSPCFIPTCAQDVAHALARAHEAVEKLLRAAGSPVRRVAYEERVAQQPRQALPAEARKRKRTPSFLASDSRDFTEQLSAPGTPTTVRASLGFWSVCSSAIHHGWHAIMHCALQFVRQVTLPFCLRRLTAAHGILSIIQMPAGPPASATRRVAACSVAGRALAACHARRRGSSGAGSRSCVGAHGGARLGGRRAVI
jgi:hypothetical protein